ncbi:MAG: hypothetical protein GY898_29095 [Proteobacteria bacterium]|nr:hypothetical protein [Pseudomonadota bacterium]
MSDSKPARTEDVLGKAPASQAIIGPGCATAGFVLWLVGIAAGSFLMTTGMVPEWGMFVVLGWPAAVGVPMVLVEARMAAEKQKSNSSE